MMAQFLKIPFGLIANTIVAMPLANTWQNKRFGEDKKRGFKSQW